MIPSFRLIKTVDSMAMIGLSTNDRWYVQTGCEYKEGHIRGSVVEFQKTPEQAVAATVERMIGLAKTGNLWLYGRRFFWNGDAFVEVDEWSSKAVVR